MEKIKVILEGNFVIPEGDNCEQQESDWKLKEFGEVLEVIKQMPTLDKQICNVSQYENIEHMTACTMYCGINGIGCIENKTFTMEERNKITELGQKNGRKPGYSWFRGTGIDTVRRWRNEQYPENKVMTFVVEYGTEEFELVRDRLGILMGTISVDGPYWQDARDNLKIDGDKFAMKNGHATCFMDTGEYICVDSVPQSVWKENIKVPMVYGLGENFDKLVARGNIKRDFHIFIFERRLKKGISQEERARLEKFRDELNKAIEANSSIRHLTTQEDERNERKKMNDYNRAKLRIIESMLK